MAWGAIAMAGLGAAQGILGGMAQKDAADAQNKENKKIVEAQYEQDKKAWKIDYMQKKSDFAWNLANVEAAKYQEKVKEAYYNFQQGITIDSALMNLTLNSQAIHDQYVVSEQLRAQQEMMGLSYDLTQEAQALNKATLDATYNANINNLQSMQNVANYMSSIKQQGLQADELLANKQNEGIAIQEQILIGEQLDGLRRDAEAVTALLDAADTRAGLSARQGGTNSSRALAMNSMKEFGRNYQELKAVQADRRRALTNYNAEFAGETSVQMAQIAQAISDEAAKISFTEEKNTLNYDLLMSNAEQAKAQYDTNTQFKLDQFEKLTIPTFTLAENQGNLQYKSLVQNTINEVKAASLPYQKAIIFDPLPPIKGLKPTKGTFTKAQGPSWGSIIAGSVIEGAKGAMSMSYKNEDGGLSFY